MVWTSLPSRNPIKFAKLEDEEYDELNAEDQAEYDNKVEHNARVKMLRNQIGKPGAVGTYYPRSFVFEGSVIIITNNNFEAMISSGSKFAPHCEALMSRSFYIDLTMETVREKMIWVRHVFTSLGMAAGLGLADEEAAEIVDFVTENRDRFFEVSLRQMKLITQMYRSNPDNWKKVITRTKMRKVRK